MRCVKVLVYGEVQGVGFRRYVWSLAKRIGLRGYVKNLDDGSVEIVIQGNSDEINEFLKKLNSTQVFTITNIVVNELEDYIVFNDFNMM